MKWEAIFLAGGKLEKKFASFGSAPGKAYLSLNGKRMADYPLSALKRIPEIERIVAVIPAGAPSFPDTVSIVGGETLIQSLSAGFQAARPETDLALVVTCDIPCLTQEAVLDFLRSCEQYRAGLYYSFVSRNDSEKKFPGIPHTYVKLVEGEVCGGGLLAISPKHFPALYALAERATQNRKNIFELAKIFGLRFILKFLFRKLSVPDLEKRAGELLGFPVKGIHSRYPEIAFNIDDPETLRQACDFLPKAEAEKSVSQEHS